MASVLLVDDDPLVRDACRTILEMAGHTVQAAAQGQQALSLLREHKYDVIVADLCMPIVDGLALTETIGTEYPAIPVIVYTGESRGSVWKALQCGASTVLTKPFDPDVLLEAIERSLAR